MSRTKLRSAYFSINEIVKQSSYRAYASRYDMSVMLKKCVRELHQMGFKIGHVKGLKAKHVYKLVEHWKVQGKSTATLKNYLSKFRELGKILKCEKLVKSDNAAYNLGSRQYFPKQSKAIHEIDFSKCTDSLIRLSMEGQYLFGLRREESIKFIVSEAAQRKGWIDLKSSWTKGGIGRRVPVTNQAQLAWIERVKQAVKPGQALIYEGTRYVEQLNKYAYQTRRMGLSQLHGLRHAYAQRRYRELTTYYSPQQKGWECPFNGGPKKMELTPAQQHIDFKVRHILTRELGHSRLSVLKTYCG